MSGLSLHSPGYGALLEYCTHLKTFAFFQTMRDVWILSRMVLDQYASIFRTSSAMGIGGK